MSSVFRVSFPVVEVELEVTSSLSPVFSLSLDEHDSEELVESEESDEDAVSSGT